MKKLRCLLTLSLLLLISFLLRYDDISVRSRSLIPDIDYVRGEVIVVFSKAMMPAKENISLTSPRFGITDLDSILNFYGAKRLEKLLHTYNQSATLSGQMLERTFLLKYSEAIDAKQLVALLSQMLYFEFVGLNEKLPKELHGVKRFVPGSDTRFSDQWYLDCINDRQDIDMPEAWGVEKGDTNLVIVIHDNGAMIDTVSTEAEDNWIIHPDYNHAWISSVPIILRQRLNVNRRAVGGDRDGRFSCQASRC